MDNLEAFRTILKDELRVVHEDIQQLETRMNGRFEGVNERFDGVDQRLDGVDQRLDGVDQRLDAMDRRFDGVDQQLAAVSQRFDGVDQQFVTLEQRIDKKFEMRLQPLWAALNHLRTSLTDRMDRADERADRLEKFVLDHTIGTRSAISALKDSIESRDFRLNEHGQRITRLEHGFGPLKADVQELERTVSRITQQDDEGS